MERYKHTQISYPMIAITLVMLAFFSWLQIAARLEPPSVDSGMNFAVTAVMAFVLFVLASFSTLTVVVDGTSLKIRFGFGMFRKRFPLAEIDSAKRVKNHWYYGWGIRWWPWPNRWIFSVAGFDAVELRMKNGKIYRIGTDEPEVLEAALSKPAG